MESNELPKNIISYKYSGTPLRRDTIGTAQSVIIKEVYCHHFRGNFIH